MRPYKPNIIQNLGKKIFYCEQYRKTKILQNLVSRRKKCKSSSGAFTITFILCSAIRVFLSNKKFEQRRIDAVECLIQRSHYRI